MEQKTIEYLTNLVVLESINLFLLLMFWGAGIYKLTHFYVDSPTAGRMRVFSSLKPVWKIITTFVGLIFSPGLLVLFLIYKIGNYKDKSGLGTGKYEDEREIFTKKYFFFYVDSSNGEAEWEED